MRNEKQFLNQVSITDGFWKSIRETVRTHGIPYQWEALNDRLPDTEPSYSMRNFRIASGKETGKHGGMVFQDSDVAKWLESVAYILKWHPDADLEKEADKAIDDIVAAQQPDGYLDTYYIINGLDKRWTNLKDNHELYCAGHMIEAAVAYYQTTGKRKLLDAMIRLVDHIDSQFGLEGGKKKGYPGHPIIEMALIRLYEVTGDARHLKLAKYFVDQRGQAPLYFQQEMDQYGNGFYWKDSPFQFQYYQAGLPVREQQEAEGHSVRAAYLYSGMTDVARLTNDTELLAACERLWNSIVHKRMYITGAIGSSEYGEAFTYDYDLPNDTIYGETCASIALMFFAQRLLKIQVKSEYADVMERALYNCILDGMQLDGKKFFYVNPLEVNPLASAKDYNKRHVKPERQKWFACACCPPNLNRLVGSLEKYIYAVDEDTLYCHLYIGSDVNFDIQNKEVQLHCDTEYPWHENITYTFCQNDSVHFKLALRIPDWCRGFSILVNKQAENYVMENGYAILERTWAKGDSVSLILEMPVQLNRANPKVKENAGCVAVSRGPIVYCLEEADVGKDLHMITLDQIQSKDFSTQQITIDGYSMIGLTSPGWRESDREWENTLYSSVMNSSREKIELKWIPYYAWSNRGLGEMRVWIRKG